jgi:hypothetical protein
MRTIFKLAALCVLAVAVFAGVYLALRTTFELKGLDFVTDGNCILRISYSTNRPATARLTTYDNQLLDEVGLDPGASSADLVLARNRATLRAPVLVTIEQGGNVIWSGSLQAPAVSIRLTGIVEWGWDNGAGQSTIERVAVVLGNSGGIPAYVSRVSGQLDGRLAGGVSTEWTPVGGGELGRWIMPSSEESIVLEWSGPPLSPGIHGFKLTAEDVEGAELATMPFPSIINVPSEYVHGERMAEGWSGGIWAPAGWYRPENWRM